MLPAPFIVGVARSGTTLLRLQLDAHPDLAIPPETAFGDVLRHAGERELSRDELLDALSALPTWPDLGVERGELAEAFELTPDWSIGAGLRAYYRAYAAGHGKTRWGDETPGHASRLGLLAAALPEARFIHVIRDGRDVAASLRGLPGDGGIPAIAAHWRDTLWRARRAGATLPHYAEVRYERLVAEPEEVLRELCTYLELDFDESMLRAHERAGERLGELRTATMEEGQVRLADGARIAARTLAPPDPSRSGRWRDDLTEHEVARFERFAGGALAAAGYPPYERPWSATAPRRAADTNRSMRIVLGRHSLTRPGGTETYALTVARELERLGHDVTLAGEELGLFADHARDQGVHVVHTGELPSGCDAVLAHDAPMAALLAERYPGARLVYAIHSDASDLQLPPVLPGVVDAVVACSDRMAARARAVPLEAPIVRLREPIDTDARLYPRPLNPRPRRALLLSSYLQGERRRMLVDAFEGAGIECVQVGTPGSVVLDPRPEIEAADIVVAKGRAALEAMCSGRAVYLYDQYGGDGWVTVDSYPAMEADHFGGQSTPRPRTAADIAGDLAGYSPDMGILNSELVRTHHGARHHTVELVEVLRGEHIRDPDLAEPVAEVARLARATGRAESRTRDFVRRAETAEAHLAEWRARADEAERQLAETRALLDTKRVQAGLAIGRVADRLRTKT